MQQANGMDDLSNKTILVTGTSKGIGVAIVKSLVAQGANVVAHYCSGTKIDFL